MAHQVILSDTDYERLVKAAQKQGVAIEDVLHEAIAIQFSDTQIGSYHRPTGEPISESLLQENERLAALIGSAKPWASEMIIEDRGPRWCPAISSIHQRW